MTGRLTQRSRFGDDPPISGFKHLPLNEYDIIAVSYCGGKDSLA